MKMVLTEFLRGPGMAGLGFMRQPHGASETALYVLLGTTVRVSTCVLDSLKTCWEGLMFSMIMSILYIQSYVASDSNADP